MRVYDLFKRADDVYISFSTENVERRDAEPFYSFDTDVPKVQPLWAKEEEFEIYERPIGENQDEYVVDAQPRIEFRFEEPRTLLLAAGEPRKLLSAGRQPLLLAAPEELTQTIAEILGGETQHVIYFSDVEFRDGIETVVEDRIVREKRRSFLGAKIISAIMMIIGLAAILFPSASLREAKVSYEVNPTNTTPGLSFSIENNDMTVADGKGNLSIQTQPNQLVTSTLDLDVSTTGADGYKLYVTTSGKDKQGDYTNALVNKDVTGADGRGAKIQSLTSDSAKSAFPAGYWGYTTAPSVQDNTMFKAFPVYDATDEEKLGGVEIASVNTAVADEDAAGETPFTIGIKADENLPAGDYANELLFTVIVNPVTITYNLSFNGNTEDDSLADMPEMVTVASADVFRNVTIPAGVPTRDKYAFVGWADTADATEAAYAPGDEVLMQVANINDSQIVNKTLYAIWEELPDDTKYLQDFNDAIGLRTVGDSDTYVDKRDGEEYTVKRLADGKVWMTQNLRYADGAHYVSSNREYGGYYDWETSQSVCPAGWHQPTAVDFQTIVIKAGGSGSSSSETNATVFGRLTSTSGSYPGYVMAGLLNYPYTDGVIQPGVVGGWWTPDVVPSDSSRGYLFFLVASQNRIDAYHANSSPKTQSMSVRCVADQPNSFYLQDFDESKMLPNTGDSATLTDKRDGATYTVKRLADGKVWMTQNLRYMGTSSDPGTASITSGSFTTTTELSQGNSTVGIVSSFTAAAGNKQARYNGNTTYGAYYTWEAALNVCPAGWHLADKNEFATLYTYYNTAAKLTSADGPYFVKAGDYVGGGATLKETSNGYVFSATETDSTRAETFAITSTNVVYATYANQYKYSASSARCIADDDAKVTFNANGGEGTMAVQSFTRGTAQAIAANQFTRAGYKFVGWALSADAGVPKYTDQESVRFSVATTLYAVWKPNYLQDFDAKTALLEVGDAATLVDKRDTATYTVKRLPDGKVWMTQNLRYAGTETDPANTVQSAGSFQTNTTTSQTAGTINRTNSGFGSNNDSYMYFGGNITNGAFYTWQAAQYVCPAGWHIPTGGDGGEFAQLDKAYGYSGQNSTNATQMNQYLDSTGSNPGFVKAGYFGSGGVNNYIAGYGLYWSANDDSISNAKNLYLYGNNVWPNHTNGAKHGASNVRCIANETETVSFDANGGAGEMADVTVEKGNTVTLTNSFTNPAYNFVGWATSADGEKVYDDGATITPAEDMTLYALWTPKGEFMQDFNQDTELLTVGSAKTLYDERDGNIYTVRRLADGKVWMVKDLGFTDNGKYRTSDYGAVYTWDNAQSVCPAGWHIVDKTEARSLDIAWGGTGEGGKNSSTYQYFLGMDYLNLIQVGRYSYTKNAFEYVGLRAYYWTGNEFATDSTKGNNLYVNSLNDSNQVEFYDKNGSDKRNEQPVRCVADYQEYTVSFNANGGTGTAPAAVKVVSGQEVTLPANTLTKANYEFLGWATSASATEAEYEDGATITATGNLELYAVWVNTFYSITTMQEMTDNICSQVTTPSKTALYVDELGDHIGDSNYIPQRTLKDVRDNTTYVIRKLADGNCWMAEDMKAQGVKLTAAESDNLTADFTLPASNGSWQSDGVTTPRTFIDTLTGSTVLYSWYAATAGTNRTLTGAGVTPGSICPKGWELPRDSGNKSFQDMIGTIYGGASNVNVMRSWPISIPAMGMMIPTYTTTGGWGNNYSIHYTAGAVDTNTPYVSIGASGRTDLRYAHTAPHVGFAVRCVAK